MENKQNIEQFDLVTPAKELLDAVVVQADAKSNKPMTAESHKNMKLTLGYLNTYIKAFSTKVSYFKMTNVKEKIDAIKDNQ